eukprot:2610630-Amphidinium_carterae.1
MVLVVSAFIQINLGTGEHAQTRGTLLVGPKSQDILVMNDSGVLDVAMAIMAFSNWLTEMKVDPL